MVADSAVTERPENLLSRQHFIFWCAKFCCQDEKNKNKKVIFSFIENKLVNSRLFIYLFIHGPHLDKI